LFLTIASLAFANEPFVDPAPPTFHQTSAAPIVEAKENPDITFHSAPKALAPGTVVSDWPSFLGPTHNAFSPETNLLADLSKTPPQLVWEMKKGQGYAAPAIVDGRLIVFHRVADDEVVDCLDAKNGNRFWQFKYPTAYQDRYGYCDGPRSSPAISDGRVFAIGAEGKLHCLSLASGQLLWQRDLLTEYKLTQNFFGVGASPLVEGDKLIVNVGATGGPCVAAFDVKTGKQVWGAGDEWGPSYATPTPAVIHGKYRVLVFAGGESKPPTGGLLVIDPANGHVDCTFPWRGTRRESVNASSPVVIDNSVFVSECYGSGGALVDLKEDGSCQALWTNESFGTHFMSAIPWKGYLYGIDGHGPEDAFFVCVGISDGKEKWRTRPEWADIVTDQGSRHRENTGTDRCSLLMTGDGRCLCLGEYGHLLWLDLNPIGFKQTSRTWLFAASDTWTPPVLSHGLLYICQNTPGLFHNEPLRLLCYDMRAATK
jgi:outer membrane protein assembly factor BamB